MAKIYPDPALPWPISYEAVQLIADSESLRLVAYQCPAGKWTIGWGETDGVKPGDTCTKEQADRWLLEDLIDRLKALSEMAPQGATANQTGALMSLAYNIGLEALRKSTVLRKHNEGDFMAASRAFGLWNKARNPNTGQLEEFAGLTARRARESALYLQPDGDFVYDMPQAVNGESTLAKSPIVLGSAGTAGTGTVVAIGAAFSEQIAPVIKQAKEFADQLSVNPLHVLAAVLIVAGLVGLYNRFKQRDQGWA